MAETVGGSCLCGGVRFEVTLPFTRAIHCHCSRCRKHSGAFGLTVGHVPMSQVHVLQGEELIRVFEPPGGRVKAFCSQCGSSLFGGAWPDGEMASVRLGALDGDPEVRPVTPLVRRLPRTLGRAARRRACRGTRHMPPPNA